MKFSLSDINPKFLAANAEALRAQGVDVSKLGKLSENGVLDSVLVMAEKKGRKTLAESRLEMANGKTIMADGEAKGAFRGHAGKEVRFLCIDEVAEWPGVRFTIPGVPMGKPRMTQRDKWAKREVVLRYREWADSARAAAPAELPTRPVRVNWTAYLPMPASWSKKKRAAHAGQPHRAKPDRDNIDKALLDALWDDDSCISSGSITKRWEDEKGPRLEVEVFSS